jgi:hypothetical protein
MCNAVEAIFAWLLEKVCGNSDWNNAYL